MGLTVPLTVRLRTTRMERDITREVHSLRYRSSVAGGGGGFASATIPLNRRLDIPASEVDYYAGVYVDDRETGERCWEGLIEDFGRQVGRDGQVLHLVATGPASIAKDRTVPYVLADQSLQPWVRVDTNNIAGGQASVTQDPLDNTAAGLQGWKLHFTQGLTIDNGSHIAIQYNPMWHANHKVARFDYAFTGGGTDNQYLVFTELYTAGGGTAVRPRSDTLTPGVGSTPKVVVTDWANSGYDTMRIDLWRSAAPGPVTIGNDGFWAHIHSLIVLAMRYDQTGAEITSGYTTNSLLASDVVKDLLGRLLPLYDGTGAAITASSYAIDQLAYYDAANPYKVMSDLAILEPGFYWAAWESNPAGKYRFEYSPWPSVVRYECDIADGYDAAASAADFYNACRVRYKTPTGDIMTLQRTQAVPQLTAAGRTREAFLDLGAEIGSVAAAARAGDQFLLEHLYAPNAGRLRIARPVIDAVTGRLIPTRRIRPGHLIRCRGIQPSPDALNRTARDGVSTMKVMAVDYDSRDDAATLELDSTPLTVTQAVANLQQGQPATGQPRRR